MGYQGAGELGSISGDTDPLAFSYPRGAAVTKPARALSGAELIGGDFAGARFCSGGLWQRSQEMGALLRPGEGWAIRGGPSPWADKPEVF
jgi:hypothetical protein